MAVRRSPSNEPLPVHSRRHIQPQKQQKYSAAPSLASIPNPKTSSPEIFHYISPDSDPSSPPRSPPLPPKPRPGPSSFPHSRSGSSSGYDTTTTNTTSSLPYRKGRSITTALSPERNLPTSRKSSPGAELRQLDVKRLMSKPASPSNTFSPHSLPTSPGRSSYELPSPAMSPPRSRLREQPSFSSRTHVSRLDPPQRPTTAPIEPRASHNLRERERSRTRSVFDRHEIIQHISTPITIPRNTTPVLTPATTTSSSSTAPRRPPPLTPAASVAMAYRASEKRREQLAAEASPGTFDIDLPRPTSPARMPEQTTGPAIVEPEDDPISYKSPLAFAQTLTRKASQKFKRPRTASGTEASDRPSRSRDGSVDSRRDHFNRPVLRISTDQSTDVATPVPTAMLTGTTDRGVHTNSGWPTEDNRFDTFGRTPNRKETKAADASSPSSSLWKLVKRISSSALRDKSLAQSFDSSTAPPVPPLPSSIRPDSEISPAPTRSSTVSSKQDSKQRAKPQYISTPGLSRPRRPSTTTLSSSPISSDIASSRFFVNNLSSARSSSSSYGEELVPPVPSVGAGHEQPRRQKSAPATYDEKPKLPPSNLNIHDTPISHHNSLSSKNSSHSSNFNTISNRTIRNVAHERESITPPERKGDESPTMPTFSTSARINDFSGETPLSRTPFLETTGVRPANPKPYPVSSEPSLKVTGAGNQDNSLKNPPVPRRDPRRPSTLPGGANTPRGFTVPAVLTIEGGTNAQRAFNRSPSPPSPPFPDGLSPRTLALNDQRAVFNPNASGRRESHFASPQARSLSVDASKTAVSPRFRKLDAPVKTLSEREKNDRWNELLMRSDLAGGTLHASTSTGGLLSDEASDLL
ncbi:hypothetical protein SISSUDRAFT_1125090 [Sistotremastrum suecicum HHB10207 ss-3]|uniref:Uncharacterized protein n=1 Tax=Sistotremastrum suecicum HHB10207 ss-3 TaxID=1314776 RepID=A0A166HYR1_9AGAM|nr:hypothetical protein SISSUDRAFT_1125090 [Sistotremastrum suecicum HHB10207 ss-3]